jgi:dipeptidyl aminopeptidase/acylaminoacyl peptidase
MMPTLSRLAALLVGALTAGAPLAADTAPIPIEQFFKKPAMTGASISPDGRYVALRLQSQYGRSVLTVVDAQTHELTSVANFRNGDIDNFYWQSDRRLTYSVINVDHQGDIGTPGFYAVDRDGKDRAVLSPIIVKQRSFADSDFASRAYLAAPTVNGFPYRQSEAAFAISRWQDEEKLVRINTRNARVTDVRAPLETFRWLIDAHGEVRIAVARRSGKDVVFYRDDNNWRQLAAFDPMGADSFQPLLYAEDTLYVRAHNGRNEASIYRYDLKKKALDAQPLITVPGFDADGYFIVDDSKMLGFRVNTDAENTVWFDADMKAIQAEVDALMTGTVNTISRGAHSETPYVLVDAHGDALDHLYLLYNRDTKTVLRLGAAHPDLTPEQMATMTMVRYPARDGLLIPAYVTLPETPSKRPLPTVVLVGEAQWKRNAGWDWNAEVQFLASRGYVVLQPEPRGTGGFGNAHGEAGVKQWGRAIQDDIADAVKWSVAQGHTDPARVCIAGTGYGGYAAMMGLIRDPEVFKCGVSWSGITDIAAMFERDWKDVAEPRAVPLLRNIIGDPDKDAALLNAASPLRNAARIKQPVLLAYGEEDSRVPFKDGRKFQQALAAGNPNVEWLAYKPSVEDWKTQANRIDLWRHIEAFLARNIGK